MNPNEHVANTAQPKTDAGKAPSRPTQGAAATDSDAAKKRGDEIKPRQPIVAGKSKNGATSKKPNDGPSTKSPAAKSGNDAGGR